MQPYAHNRMIDRQSGSILVVLMVLIVMSLLGYGLLMISWQVRREAVSERTNTAAVLAADAAYEQAIYWMAKQSDLLSVLTVNPSGVTDPEPIPPFAESRSNYTIFFHDFFNNRPVYRIQAQGQAGPTKRTIDAYVVQAVGGWDGPHTVPSSPAAAEAWPFASGEVIDIPVHINRHKDNPDVRDMYISGSPEFRQRVEIGENRGSKYPSNIMALFKGGVSFDQPDNKITDAAAVQSRVDRFRQSIINEGKAALFLLTPAKSSSISGDTEAAVQLEFYLSGGTGKVKITNDATIRVHAGGAGANPTNDYKIDPASKGKGYIKYPVYGYHYVATGNNGTEYNVSDTYVRQEMNGRYSTPGGEIFVDGNVVIGSKDHDQMVVQGTMTVVATGNIWIADPIVVDGSRDSDDMPAGDNPNVLGLVAQGVVKVVDPGMSEYAMVTHNGNSGPPTVSGFQYVPVANSDGSANYERNLPNPMVVEACIVVGGGGWGAENVGNRKNKSGRWDELIVRGAISEASRGIVGTATPLWNSSVHNGFYKNYHLDERLMRGLLPGDFTLQSKFVPMPAGWHESRSHKN